MKRAYKQLMCPSTCGSPIRDIDPLGKKGTSMTMIFAIPGPTGPVRRRRVLSLPSGYRVPCIRPGINRS